MIRPIWDLASRWAWSRSPDHRWRLFTLSASTLVCALMLVLGAGYVIASRAVDGRQEARRPMVVEAEGDRQVGELRIVLRGLVWEGVQTPVIWLDGDEKSPVPPGLSRLPDPGTVVVSPALRTAGFSDKTAGFRLGDAGSGPRGAIGDAGLATKTEWLVYARPPAGRTLGSGGALYDVVGFGSSTSSGWPLLVETTEPAPSQRVAELVAGLLVLLPVLTTMVVAGGAMSRLLHERFDALSRQGLRRADLARLALIESLVITLPCALAGGLIGWLAAAHASAIPLSGLRLMPGDLSVSVAVVGVCVLTVCSAASVGALARTRIDDGQGMERSSGLRVSRAAAWGLVVAVALMLVSRQMKAPTVLLGALTLAAVTISMALPAVVALLAPAGGITASPHTGLAIRRVVFNPVGMTRPAAAVAALLLCLLAFVGYQGRFMESPGASGPAEAVVTIGWRDAQVNDLERLESAARDLDVVVVRRDSDRGEGVTEIEVRGPVEGVDAMEERANALLPAVNVRDPAASLTARHDVFWYLPWGLVAGVLLTTAALVAFGNRAQSLFRDDEDLARAGLTPRDIQQVQQAELAIPSAVAIVTGSFVGSVFLWCADAVELSASSLGLVLVQIALVAGATTGAGALARRWSAQRWSSTET
ncbi:FtsX-like permease family protein [Janibacter melonis]|uniref:FtsX-like permease family protein n=1 Tax=Janibacter melonis TaxID=262209 RepID=UPI0020961A35|nr:FtsX-like permease family protein [Janibacter melonis]